MVIHQTLKDLLKALKGLVVMSQSLETMANSIFNNMVPELWAGKVSKATDTWLLFIDNCVAILDILYYYYL